MEPGEFAHTQKNEEPKALWLPKRDGTTHIERFMTFIAQKGAPSFDNFDDLHRWSVEQNEEFWSLLWEYAGVIGDKKGPVKKDIPDVPWTRFFPEAGLNYTENILAPAEENPDSPAIISRFQDDNDLILSWRELTEQVSIWQQALERAGLRKNDHIAIYLPNIAETVVIFLAAANIGAVFTSAGMEMGADDLVNRFGQVKPKLLVTGDGYQHAGKKIERFDTIRKLHGNLTTLENTIILPVLDSAVPGDLKKTQTAESFLQGVTPKPLHYERHEFNHPLYILFSSGSTGRPKCFEHSTGGVFLKHMSEYLLHCDVRKGDRVFFHATPSWMMWNWLVSGLAAGATIMIYDGAPAYPDIYAQWHFSADHNCTHHGTAAPLIMSWEKNNAAPSTECDLSTLRTIMSTAAVLPARGFDYIHQHIKNDVNICSISGGTDIVGCFVGGHDLAPTYAGQVKGPILGIDLKIWDEEGRDVSIGEPGELICANAFPSMPLRFLDDENGERYRESYFTYYKNFRVWRHGDTIEKTPQDQLKIIGRSDATLNQNGVRIGTGVIYKQLKPFAEIIEAAAIDFTRPDNHQPITVLCLKLEGVHQNVPEDLQNAIRKAVKDNVGPYSVPTEIVAVPGVLKTPNGKIAEVVMKKVINGHSLRNPSLYDETLVGEFEALAQLLRERYQG